MHNAGGKSHRLNYEQEARATGPRTNRKQERQAQERTKGKTNRHNKKQDATQPKKQRVAYTFLCAMHGDHPAWYPICK